MDATRSEPPTFSTAELNAWRGFLRTHAVVIRRLSEEIERASHLTTGEYEALLKLEISPDGELPMSRLAGKTYLTLSASGVSRLVERLARRGLVVREQVVDGDRRSATVRITEDGREAWRRAAIPNDRLVHELFLDPLSTADIDRLGAIWERLLKHEEPLDDER